MVADGRSACHRQPNRSGQSSLGETSAPSFSDAPPVLLRTPCRLDRRAPPDAVSRRVRSSSAARCLSWSMLLSTSFYITTKGIFAPVFVQALLIKRFNVAAIQADSVWSEMAPRVTWDGRE